MNAENMRTCVIFGGKGFIGSHMTRHLMAQGFTGELYLADIRVPTYEKAHCVVPYEKSLRAIIHHVNVDVREPISSEKLPKRPDLIIDLAAVHREPGHRTIEYFETNILGARHVSNWANNIGAERIIFVSSISPYGPSGDPKTEQSLVMPITPYGASKLAAEYEYRLWQAADQSRRKLVIARPGVVFGAGENANVTRMIKAVMRHYFFYMGNQKTIKAAIYVKELCHALFWALRKTETEGDGSGYCLFNGVMKDPPTIKEFAENILAAADKKSYIPSAPHRLVTVMAAMIEGFLTPLGVRHPFSPVRVKKLIRSNNVLPAYLVNSGYQFKYTLPEALQDWLRELPSDWGMKGPDEQC